MNDFADGSIFAVVMLVAMLIAARRERRTATAVESLSERSGLAVTPEVLPLLTRSRRAWQLGWAIGCPVGLELGLLVLTQDRIMPGAIAHSTLPTVCWLVLGGVSALVGSLLASRLARPIGQRIARDRRVDLGDYVDPFERRLPVASAVIALVVAGIVLVRDPSHAGPTLAIGAVGVLVPLLSLIVAARVVRAPQRVGTPTELAWQDALRAEAVRGLVWAGSAVALVVMAIVITRRFAELPADLAGIVLGLATLLTTILVFVRGRRRRPARYFLRTLWPATADLAEQNERRLALEVVQS